MYSISMLDSLLVSLFQMIVLWFTFMKATYLTPSPKIDSLVKATHIPLKCDYTWDETLFITNFVQQFFFLKKTDPTNIHRFILFNKNLIKRMSGTYQRWNKQMQQREVPGWRVAFADILLCNYDKQENPAHKKEHGWLYFHYSRP